MAISVPKTRAVGTETETKIPIRSKLREPSKLSPPVDVEPPGYPYYVEPLLIPRPHFAIKLLNDIESSPWIFFPARDSRPFVDFGAILLSPKQAEPPSLTF